MTREFRQFPIDGRSQAAQRLRSQLDSGTSSKTQEAAGTSLNPSSKRGGNGGGHRRSLIATPTDQLLLKFGSGSHKPGSGSAAALLGLLSCKLIQTVIALTADRERYQEAHATLAIAVGDLVDQIEPRLLHAFEEDSRQFHKVYEARVARNAAEEGTSERRRLNDRASTELRTATAIQLHMGELCLRLGEHAVTVFDLDFKSARGDSVVAITSAHAAVGGCLGIAYLNLQSFAGGEWAVATRKRADAVAARWNLLGEAAEQSMKVVRDKAVERERPAD